MRHILVRNWKRFLQAWTSKVSGSSVQTSSILWRLYESATVGSSKHFISRKIPIGNKSKGILETVKNTVRNTEMTGGSPYLAIQLRKIDFTYKLNKGSSLETARIPSVSAWWRSNQNHSLRRTACFQFQEKRAIIGEIRTEVSVLTISLSSI